MNVLSFSDAARQKEYEVGGMPVSLDVLKDDLKNNIFALVDYLFAGEKPSSRTAREVRYGRHGSMQIALSGSQRGNYHNHESGEGGSPLDLIMEMTRTDFQGSMEWARDWLGYGNEKAPRRVPSQQEIAAQKEAERLLQEKEKAAKVAKAMTYYASALEYSESGTADLWRGKSYFEFRQLRPLEGDSGVIMARDGLGVCLVFTARDVAGNITGFQRVYLNEEGSKAKIGPSGVSKLSMGHIHGSSWLAKTDGSPVVPNVVCIAEGPEDAITVAQFANLPCHAVFGVQNIGATPLRPGQRVIVACDNNVPNSRAAIRTQKAIFELKARGFQVAAVYPPQGYSDVNALLKGEGRASIWQMFAHLFS